jgi:hypothetical protein
MNLGEAFVDVSVKNRLNFGSALAQTDKFVASAGSKLKSLSSSVGGGILAGVGIGSGLAAFQTLGGAIATVTEAAIADEQSQSKLRATLLSTGNEVDNNAARINQLADSMRDNANVDDDATRALASYGINLGVSTDKIGDMVTAAMGLAEVTGGDASSAMENLVKANAGNFMALQKQLPLMKQMETAEEKLAYVQKLSKQGMDQRKASLNTLGGSTEQLKLASGELAETIGGMLAPALTKAAQEGTKVINVLRGVNAENAKLRAQNNEVAEGNVSKLDQLIQQQDAARKKWAAMKNAENQSNSLESTVTQVYAKAANATGIKHNRSDSDEYERLKAERDQLASGNQSPNEAAQKRLATIQERMHALALRIRGEDSTTAGQLPTAQARDVARARRQASLDNQTSPALLDKLERQRQNPNTWNKLRYGVGVGTSATADAAMEESMRRRELMKTASADKIKAERNAPKLSPEEADIKEAFKVLADALIENTKATKDKTRYVATYAR